MSKPATKPEFASDGGALIADPGTPKRHAGFLVDEAVPAHWLNWLLRNVSQWIDYLNLSGSDELTYAAPRTRVVLINPMTGFNSVSASYAPPTPDGRGWQRNGASVITDVTASGGTNRLTVPIEIPHGCELTKVRAAVHAHAVGTPQTLKMEVNRAVCDTTLSANAAFVPLGLATALTADAILEVTFTEQIDTAFEFVVVEFPSTDTAGGDIVHWIEVTYAETRATGHF
jgi:hypothetical protein